MKPKVDRSLGGAVGTELALGKAVKAVASMTRRQTNLRCKVYFRLLL